MEKVRIHGAPPFKVAVLHGGPGAPGGAWRKGETVTGFEFWRKWLLFVAIVMAVFGAIMCVANDTGLFEWMDDLFYPVFYYKTAPSAAEAAFKAWTYGVIGAVMAGWGVMMVFVVAIPFKRKESWAWTATLASVVVWFVLDTSASAFYKVIPNVILNTVALVAFVAPLIATRKFFN